MFDQTARVHMLKTHYYYSISLKFPFTYDSNVTVRSSPDLPLRKFEFEKLLLPSVIAFVAVTALALLLAIVLELVYVSRYGQREEQTYLKVVRTALAWTGGVQFVNVGGGDREDDIGPSPLPKPPLSIATTGMNLGVGLLPNLGQIIGS